MAEMKNPQGYKVPSGFCYYFLQPDGLVRISTKPEGRASEVALQHLQHLTLHAGKGEKAYVMTPLYISADSEGAE